MLQNLSREHTGNRVSLCMVQQAIGGSGKAKESSIDRRSDPSYKLYNEPAVSVHTDCLFELYKGTYRGCVTLLS